MNRAFLCVIGAVCLVAGCATRPASESEVLVTEIMRSQSPNIICHPGDIRHCEIEVDRERTCTCVEASRLLGPY
jgi:hypothetical protein